MSDDFERRVREKVEQISQSKEVKNAAKEFQNAAKDFKNMAEDMKREFSSYQNGKNFHSQQKKDTQNRQDFYRDSREKYHVGQQTQRPNDYHGTKSGQNTTVTLPDEKKYKTFSVAGTLFTVFGGIGLGIFVLFLLIASWLTALMDLFGAPFAILGSVLAILIAVSGIMLGRGIYLLKRTSRLKKYLKIVGKGQFCPIDLLVKESGRDKNFVLKDLSKMIRKKVLPGAHIDDEKTCLMLTDDIYNQYRYVQKQAEERRKEEERLKKEREKEKSHIRNGLDKDKRNGGFYEVFSNRRCGCRNKNSRKIKKNEPRSRCYCFNKRKGYFLRRLRSAVLYQRGNRKQRTADCQYSRKVYGIDRSKGFNRTGSNFPSSAG